MEKIENHEQQYINVEYFENGIEITDYTSKSKIKIMKEDISLNGKMMYVLNKRAFKNLLKSNRNIKTIFVRPKLKIFHEIIKRWDQ